MVFWIAYVSSCFFLLVFFFSPPPPPLYSTFKKLWSSKGPNLKLTSMFLSLGNLIHSHGFKSHLSQCLWILYLQLYISILCYIVLLGCFGHFKYSMPKCTSLPNTLQQRPDCYFHTRNKGSPRKTPSSTLPTSYLNNQSYFKYLEFTQFYLHCHQPNQSHHHYCSNLLNWFLQTFSTLLLPI